MIKVTKNESDDDEDNNKQFIRIPAIASQPASQPARQLFRASNWILRLEFPGLLVGGSFVRRSERIVPNSSHPPCVFIPSTMY